MTEASPLQQILLERIRRDGAMPFAAFMSLALYHPAHGYYSGARPRTGWHGDYVTSPELDPSFGQLWAGALEEMWRATGAPPEFDLIEIGPGEGGFAQSVLASARGGFGRALRVRLVERSRSARDRQRARLGHEGVAWTSSITDLEAVACGCIFANEVLDNLPVHLVEMRGGELNEVCVSERDGELVFELRPPSSPELGRFLERCGVALRDGYRYEVPLAAESLIARVARLLGRGAVVFIDYGATAHDLATRAMGSLACYSEDGVDDRPLERPGAKDITTHANWTAVLAACRAAGLATAGPLPQAEVLRRLGAARVDDALRSEHDEALRRRDGGAAVRTLSRRQALRALLDEGGLGRLDVVIATRGIDPASFIA